MPKQNHLCGWEKPRKPRPDQPDPRPGQRSSPYGSPSADERHSYGYFSNSAGNPGSQNGYQQPSQQATGYGTSQSTGYGTSQSTGYGTSQSNGYGTSQSAGSYQPQQYTQAARDPYDDRSEYSGRIKSDAWDQDEYEQPFKQDSKSRKYDQNPSSKRQERSDRY